MGNVYISCIRCQVSLCYFVLSAIETVTQQIVCLFFLTSFHSKVLKSHSSHELCFLLVDIRLHSCGIRMILNYIKTITDSQVILLLQTITIWNTYIVWISESVKSSMWHILVLQSTKIGCGHNRSYYFPIRWKWRETR